MSDFNIIPADVARLIFGYVPFDEWATLATVCRRWQKILIDALKIIYCKGESNINYKMLTRLNVWGDLDFIAAATKRWLELWPYDEILYKDEVSSKSDIRKFKIWSNKLWNIAEHDNLVFQHFMPNPVAALAVFTEMYKVISKSTHPYVRSNKMIKYILLGDWISTATDYDDWKDLGRGPLTKFRNEESLLSYCLSMLFEMRDHPDDNNYSEYNSCGCCSDNDDDDLDAFIVERQVRGKDCPENFDTIFSNLVASVEPAIGCLLTIANSACEYPMLMFIDCADMLSLTRP